MSLLSKKEIAELNRAKDEVLKEKHKAKLFMCSPDLAQWLESQPEQSGVIRKALEDYRKKQFKQQQKMCRHCAGTGFAKQKERTNVKVHKAR